MFKVGNLFHQWARNSKSLSDSRFGQFYTAQTFVQNNFSGTGCWIWWNHLRTQEGKSFYVVESDETIRGLGRDNRFMIKTRPPITGCQKKYRAFKHFKESRLIGLSLGLNQVNVCFTETCRMYTTDACSKRGTDCIPQMLYYKGVYGGKNFFSHFCNRNN